MSKKRQAVCLVVLLSVFVVVGDVVRTQNGVITGTFNGSFASTGNGTFTGNGSGLTNIQATSIAPTVVQTNFISGTVYSNFYGVPIQVSVNVVTTAAAVTGVAKMDLRISGAAGTGTTNTVAEQTGAAVITGSNTNLLMGIVPASSTYTFTNTSTGAGNSSATSGGQLIVY